MPKRSLATDVVAGAVELMDHDDVYDQMSLVGDVGEEQRGVVAYAVRTRTLGPALQCAAERFIESCITLRSSAAARSRTLGPVLQYIARVLQYAAS